MHKDVQGWFEKGWRKMLSLAAPIGMNRGSSNDVPKVTNS